MCIWDTAGGWEHDVMRPLAYQGAHYILLLYSTVDIYSFANVKAKVSALPYLPIYPSYPWYVLVPIL